jgi:predicted metal-dependent hydrolase
MPSKDAQLPLTFAHPPKKKGGLSLKSYRELVERLRADAARIAERFQLPLYELDADRPNAHDRYGVCFADGRIRVRLIHARTGRPLRYSALIDTVVHELAHLRHMNHGPHWEALYEKMLAWCRSQGIYAPQRRREPPEKPAQLGLFGTE